MQTQLLSQGAAAAAALHALSSTVPSMDDDDRYSPTSPPSLALALPLPLASTLPPSATSPPRVQAGSRISSYHPQNSPNSHRHRGRATNQQPQVHTATGLKMPPRRMRLLPDSVPIGPSTDLARNTITLRAAERRYGLQWQSLRQQYDPAASVATMDAMYGTSFGEWVRAEKHASSVALYIAETVVALNPLLSETLRVLAYICTGWSAASVAQLVRVVFPSAKAASIAVVIERLPVPLHELLCELLPVIVCPNSKRAVLDALTRNWPFATTVNLIYAIDALNSEALSHDWRLDCVRRWAAQMEAVPLQRQNQHRQHQNLNEPQNQHHQQPEKRQATATVQTDDAVGSFNFTDSFDLLAERPFPTQEQPQQQHSNNSSSTHVTSPVDEPAYDGGSADFVNGIVTPQLRRLTINRGTNHSNTTPPSPTTARNLQSFMTPQPNRHALNVDSDAAEDNPSGSSCESNSSNKIW